MYGLPEGVRACLFDLDGVLTDTASVHRKAWQAMFDGFLKQWAQHHGETFTPFDVSADYATYVDGKTREDGVRSFLESRSIRLPEGGVDDAPTERTVHGLGNQKNDAFQHVLRTDGVTVFEGSRRYLEAVTAAGFKVAVVSSSANTAEVLRLTGLETFVEVRVDGVTLRDRHIKGKPAPDSFLEAARGLDVAPDAAAVFEDALSGVAAGRAGRFGVVIGVDRIGHADALRAHGADVVVDDLADLLDRP